MGAKSFAKAYAAALGLVTWRVVNHRDKVPHVPHYPMFHHVPAELFCISKDGSCDIMKICNGAGEDFGCSAGLVFKGFPPMSVADHTVAFGVSFEGTKTEAGYHILKASNKYMQMITSEYKPSKEEQKKFKRKHSVKDFVFEEKEEESEAEGPSASEESEAEGPSASGEREPEGPSASEEKEEESEAEGPSTSEEREAEGPSASEEKEEESEAEGPSA